MLENWIKFTCDAFVAELILHLQNLALADWQYYGITIRDARSNKMIHA